MSSKTEDRPAEVEYESSAIPHVRLNVFLPNVTEPITVDALSTDTLSDVRTLLSELPETCDLSCFHLEFDGQRISDFFELKSIPGVVPSPESNESTEETEIPVCRLTLVPDNYDESSARDHVHLFRDILVHPRVFQKSSNFVDVLNCEASALTDFSRVMTEAKKRLLSKKPLGKNASRKAKRGAQTVTAKDLVVSSLIPAMTATEFYNPVVAEMVPCLQNITFSAWNPVPRHRALHGDLFYLDVVTLDGKTLCVTAARDGFFVNQTTASSFNPSASAVPGHAKARTLALLLSAASPAFAEKWNALLTRKHPLHHLEVQTSTIPAPTWTALPRKHQPDWNKADSVASGFYGMDARAPVREWNEELHAVRAMPGEQPKDRMDRDRVLQRIHLDFVEAAKQGATAVVDGLVMPINPTDPPRAHVYVYNNIFYSFAVDSNQHGVNVGGDATARKLAKGDLVGMQVLVASDVKGLNCTPTIVVDYLGARVVAQAVVPGVLTQLTTPLAGTLDQGAHYADLETLGADKEAQKEQAIAGFEQVARALHVKPRQLKGTEEPEAHAAILPAGVKALVGSDQRTYLLDLMNALPRDANYPELTSLGCVVRPEAVREFCRARAMTAAMPLLKQEAELQEALRAKALAHARAQQEKKLQALKARQEKIAAAVKAGDEAAQAEAEKEVPVEDDEDVELETEEQRAERMRLRKEAEAAFQAAFNAIRFNPDLYTVAEAHIVAPEEEIAADRALLQELATFIREDLVQALLREHAAADKAPADGAALSASMHARGLNMRYLGVVAAAAAKGDKPGHAALRRAAVEQIVARAAKAVLNELLRDSRAGLLPEVPHTAALVAAFFSALTGAHTASEEEQQAADTVALAYAAAAAAREAEAVAGSEQESIVLPHLSPISVEAPLVAGAPVSTDRLHPANVWAAVRLQAQRKFAHELPAALALSSSERGLLLRSLCLQTGVQIHTKDWDFTSAVPVSVSDVLSISPCVAAIQLDSRDSRSVLQLAKLLMQNSELELAYSYLHEASALYAQTLGALAPQLAEAYYLLSGIAIAVEELNVALDVLYRALIIAQKQRGLDSAAVAALHSHLGMVLVLMGRPSVALRHLRRALFIYELLSGPASATAVATHLNIALALFSAGKPDAAFTHMREAIAQSTAAHGESPVLLPLVECMALMHYYQAEYKLAAEAIQTNVRILKAAVPEAEHNTNKALGKAQSLATRFTQLAAVQELPADKLVAGAKEYIDKVKADSVEALREHVLVRSFWSEMPLDISIPSRTIDRDMETTGDDHVPYTIGAMNRVYTKKQ